MLNEAKYRETVGSIENDMATCRSRIESWKAVGKNYSLKKNGQPYADVAKSFKGVDGIDGVKKYKICGAPQYFLCNSAGFSIEITGMSIPEIEKEIEKEIEWLESIYQTVELEAEWENIIPDRYIVLLLRDHGQGDLYVINFMSAGYEEDEIRKIWIDDSKMDISDFVERLDILGCDPTKDKVKWNFAG